MGDSGGAQTASDSPTGSATSGLLASATDASFTSASGGLTVVAGGGSASASATSAAAGGASSAAGASGAVSETDNHEERS
jgi:hypothetical protein